MKVYLVLPVFGRRPRPLRSVSSLLVAVLITSLLSAVAFVAAAVGPGMTSAVADASTGSGGTFVPLQGRLASTVTGLGLPKAKLTAGKWTAIQAGGVTPANQSAQSQQIPLSATAIAVTLEAVGQTPTSSGSVLAAKGGDYSHSFSALNYDTGYTGSIANSAIVALSSNGVFDVQASTSIDFNVDVQGYYTGGATGHGGYVPVNPTRLADTRSAPGIDGTAHTLTGGSTYTVTVPTTSVPSGASAVFVNFTVIDTGTSDSGYLVPFAEGDAKPGTSLNYSPNANTALGCSTAASPR